MKYKTEIIQAVLFITTLITTTLAGAEAMTGSHFSFSPRLTHFIFPMMFGKAYNSPFLFSPS
ncbi:MAG: hypothetical protein V4585_11525 [Bacteroidota bacterium]